jgi:histidinol-phosphate aminotransferase
MNTIHDLARKHLSQKNQLGGIPSKVENPFLKQLHLNINYFSDSNYINYPQDEDENISRQYIDFLKQEALWKKKLLPSFIKPYHLLFFASSNAIDLIIRAFCEPIKESICITSPTFPLYAYCAYNHNSSVIDIPLEGRSLDVLNVSKIAASNSKILFIPVPNNPVGTIPNRQTIIELFNEFKGLIVLDEAYIEYADEGSFIEYLPYYPNLIILRSFSKIWGHAGIRSGVIIGSEIILNTLKQILPPFFFPAHTQEILRITLDDPYQVFKMKEQTRIERQKLEHGFKTLPQVCYVYPSQSNFLLVEFYEGLSIYAKLLQKGVLVRNLHSLIPNALRISLGKPEDNDRLLKLVSAF